MNRFQFSIGRLLAGTFVFAVVFRFIQRLPGTGFLRGLYEGMYPVRWFFGAEPTKYIPLRGDHSFLEFLGGFVGAMLSIAAFIFALFVVLSAAHYAITGNDMTEQTEDTGPPI